MDGITTHHQHKIGKILIGQLFFNLSEEEKRKTENRKESSHICNEKFTCIQDLKVHKYENHGVHAFPCIVCPKTFESEET